MNEKLQYASMIELPESSTITYKPIKKKRAKKKAETNLESVKQELLDKVNGENQYSALSNPLFINQEQTQEVQEMQETQERQEESSVSIAPKKSFRFSIVSLQLVLVVALIAIIAVTNVLNENSGINVFMKSLFSPSEKAVVDEREFNQFTPVFGFNSSQDLVLENGVTKFSGKGSVYAPCDAIVESIEISGDGMYSLTLSHSQNFSSKIEGLKYVYANVGDSVFSNIPVGYIDGENASLCFFDSEKVLITGYEIIDNMVVWAV